MELQALKTFQAVVEEGGVISASRKLNTVQSNVTSRIKRLEEELGAELFYRKGRGLELAPQGKVLLEYAKQLLHLEKQAGTAVREAGENAGELRIGSMETFAALKLPHSIKRLRDEFPQLHLSVHTDTSNPLAEAVLNYKLDCAFVSGAIDHPDLVAEAVQEETLVILHQKGTDITSLPLILFKEGCAYRTRALDWQRERGEAYASKMELGSLDGILSCVSMGLGYTIIPAWVIETCRFKKDLEIDYLPDHIAQMTTHLIRHKNTTSLKAIQAMIDVYR
ncbi:LysR family transcriptional regulator [Curvivirga sp.]|uniref:LysR family transcriptional regulator n=1 Tax=Curvivirga sp. TaxID=2856848 RepID=UPI003B5C18D1